MVQCFVMCEPLQINNSLLGVFVSEGSKAEATYSARTEEYENKIAQMANKIFGPNQSPPICLLIDRNIFSFPSAGKTWISIPYLFLLKSEDIPKEFLIHDLSDLRLQSDAFLLKVADWTSQFFGLATKKPLTLMEKETLKIFLQYIKDPEKSESAKEFVLAHEIGHIFHRHSHGFILPRILSLTNLLVIAGLILVILLAIFLIPTPFSWGAVGVIALVTGISAICRLNLIHRSRSCEKEADLVAAKFSERARQGGVYLFKTIAEGQKRSRDQNIWLRLLFSSEGNNRALYFSHPSETERVRYLQNEQF